MKIWKILKHPGNTFEEVYRESLGESLLYYLIIVSILTIIMLALGSVFISMFISGFFEEFPMLQWVSLPILFVFIPLFGFLTLLISSLFVHIFVLIFGGRQGLKQTIKALAYSSTPAVLSAWLPPILALSIVWSLILLWIGIRKLQKMNRIMTIFSILLPPIIIFAIGLLLKFLR